MINFWSKYLLLTNTAVGLSADAVLAEVGVGVFARVEELANVAAVKVKDTFA